MKNCNVNFGKVNNKSVKVFDGDKARKDIEIIGSKGSYSIWTDPSNKTLGSLRGKTGTLSEVKAQVSKAMCETASDSKKGKTKKAVASTASA